MVRAWHIDEGARLTPLDLPADDAGAQYAQIRSAVGGSAEAAYYHRAAVLHVPSTGSVDGLEPNLAGWALACGWRQMDLPYLLYGPIVITGSYDAESAAVGELSGRLTAQVRTVCDTVQETVIGWRTRRPASNEAALSELLAYTRRDLAAVISSP
ncbi:hypothetical protein N4G70_32395 [Streptomyces sp. ASQP_92]|uniref:hypothetical protein n=1 Tax=Streptomyces sp. ASQP_92 TaxID=2979116 RepID=UPI0021BE53C1|nr:hypothetical protein [Streptomyces sp. ASQP_92]MCT9093534.1 hypothetical protein [Streptomyces sp. ASQP_92]